MVQRMNDRPQPTVDGARRRELAVRASVHPETVRKALRGESVRGLAGHRIRALLAAEGLLPPAPTPADARVA